MIENYIVRDSISLPENTIVIDRIRFNMIDPDTTLIRSISGTVVRLSELNIFYANNGNGNILKLSPDLMRRMGLDFGMDCVQLISVDDEHENIYIIGCPQKSTDSTLIKDVESAAKNLDGCGNIRYEKPEPDVPNIRSIITRFNNINWANIIHVITKADGMIDNEIVYEIEYAKRIGKTIQIHNVHDENQPTMHINDLEDFGKEE